MDAYEWAWLLRLVLAVAAIGVIDRANAASAVALSPPGHLTISAGQRSVELAKYDALTTARKKYGNNAHLLACRGRSGYGAIAVASLFLPREPA